MNGTQREIELPSGITALRDGHRIVLSHQNKSVSRDLGKEKIEIEIRGNKLVLASRKATRRELALLNSLEGHVQNMIKGLETPFEYRLSVVYSHFPVTLSIKEGVVEINNFLGEKRPRRATILPDTQVEVKGKEVVVRSHNKEHAGQTAGNLETATRVIGKDRRVYQDGIFITHIPDKK